MDSFCSKLTTDEARELAETLSGLGPGVTKFGLKYRLAGEGEQVIDADEDLALLSRSSRISRTARRKISAADQQKEQRMKGS